MILTRKFTISAIAVLIALFAAGQVFADPDPLFQLPQRTLYGNLGKPGDPLPFKAAMRTGKLPNGLQYYILENSLPSDRAYLTLAVNAGSVLENDDEQGLAHFVEHMAFNGTRRFPGTELVNYLRSLGMRFGPEVNAYTSFEETVYGIETPVEQGADGKKRIPEKALAILDDWTWAISFNPEDIDKERAIIIEEYRARLGAQERVRRQVLPVIFRGSRFAERFPIGLPEIIQNAPAEKLTGFYRSWYRPDNMAVILVGDFDGAVVEKELTAHFTAPASGTPFIRPQYELPDPKKGSVTTAVITDAELTGSTVYLYYKRSPKALSRTLQNYREGLVDYLIEMMIDFRYEEKIAVEDTPYMVAGSWNSRFGRMSRYYVMAANAKAGRIDQTLETLLMEKERLNRYGFTQTELSRAKGAFLSYLEMIESEKDRRESDEFINEITNEFLREQFVLDPEWELNAALQILPGIGLETVNSTLRNYYADDDLSVIITAPEAETPPDETAILAMIRKSLDAVIEPPKERSAAASPVSETAAPGTIVSIRQDESGAEIWELSNGMRVILFETANRNNELDIYALAPGGTVSAAGGGLMDGYNFSPEEAMFSARLAAEIQSASGLGDLSKPELMDFLSDKQVSISFWSGFHIRGIRGASTLRDLPVMFQMIYASFTRPRVDHNGFAQVLDSHRTRLLREDDNPERVFSKELSLLRYGNHPAFRPLELDDLGAISEKAAITFLKLALNPADYTVVLAGSLGDRKALRELTETWLASIPYQGLLRWNSVFNPDLQRPGKTEKILHKGKEEKAIVYMGWFIPKAWTERDNAVVLALNEYLDIVLTDEIREKRGGVYSVSAGASLNPVPTGELSLEVYFICDPNREAELRGVVKEQLASLAAAIDEETLSRSTEALVKTFERSMENNSFIARNLATFFVVTGEPLFHLADRPGLYRAVKAEQIRAILTDLLKGGPVEFVLLPEAADN